MELTESTASGVGRGRGNATNVPERSLISEVKQRPLLYDKNVKDYRKPGVSDSAWRDVATALQASVTNCKKRWKSLRDTFIKYYRLEVLYSTGESKRKHKKWHYYQDLLFLRSHVELFRLEDGSRESSAYIKGETGDFSDSDQKYLIEDNEGDKTEYEELYEIRTNEDDFDEASSSYKITEDHLTYDEEEDLEYELLEQPEDKKDDNEPVDSYQVEEEPEEDSQAELPQTRVVNLNLDSVIEPPAQLPPIASSSSPAKNIVDPDERYLMSCLPTFKRFTPQQKAYVRMGIERLFYEVEFESVPDSRSKRAKVD